jgi:UDP:flavonoid glycosyltransferase YjiC (YdhE family)
MQITIIAGGSRGDVQPYVALGKGLKEAGHTVHILTSDDFQTLVTNYNLEYFSTGGSAEVVARSMQKLLDQGNYLKIRMQMVESSQRQAAQTAKYGLAACQGSDLILAGMGGLFMGLALSEKLGIPFWPAYLVPFTPTSAFPGALTPFPQTPLTRWLNKPSQYLTRQILWQSFRAAGNKVREQFLHMAPAPFWGPFASQKRQKQPILYGYSSYVLPHPRDWDDSQHVTGYWFLEPAQGWEPPADLLQFLQAGPPPVYIGFGSMSSSKPEETADQALEALARTGQRGVLYEG